MSFSRTPALTSEHVRLEGLSPAHAPALREAVTPGRLWEKWSTAVPSPEGMEAEIERRLQLQVQGSMAPWAIIDPSTGAAVGMSTFMHIDAQNRRVEVGSTWLGQRAQGTLINPAAKRLLLARAFEELECIAVEFRTHWHNHHSRAAIAKLGAKQDGVLRSHQIGAQGTLRDTVVFSILAHEWPAVRLGLDARLGAASGHQG